MLNTAPSRSLARRTRQLVFFGFMSLAAGVFLLSVGILLYNILFAREGTTAFQVQRFFAVTLLTLGGTGLLGAVYFLLRAAIRRRENDLAVLTGEVLAPHFDERYRLIRNINRPGLGYIDAVLVGPPGILVFRILKHTGQFANTGEDWLRKNKQGDWTPWTINPTHDTLVDVKAVDRFLRRKKLPELDIYGLVVFIEAEPNVTLKLQNPAIPVTHLAEAFDTMKGEYLAAQRMDGRLVEQVTRLLLGVD
jgi:hypothetical protein